MTPDILRYAAFTTDPAGGNLAGVVLDASGLGDFAMQALAADVGYPETAFLRPDGAGGYAVRYFSPSAEVSFCGHATVASGVALGERLGEGVFVLRTRVGAVPVEAAKDSGGAMRARFTSVDPSLRDISGADFSALLASLRWSREDLDTGLPPRVMYAGGWHPVVAVSTRARLADLDADLEMLSALSIEQSWNSAFLVWREAPSIFHVRNLAPAIGVVEDPATGSAAAAFGHYVRSLELIALPARLTIRQGDDLGRPSILTVEVDERPGVRVSGNAVPV